MATSAAEPDIAPEVGEYLDAVPADQRGVFGRLHNLVLRTIPGVKVRISYKMPTYIGQAGRVSLSSGKAGVTLATTTAEPVAAFVRHHPRFAAGKVTVRFQPDDELPEEDLRRLITDATRAGAKPPVT